MKFFLAPRVGFEPTTKWLTATYSATELPGNGIRFWDAEMYRLFGVVSTWGVGIFLEVKRVLGWGLVYRLRRMVG